MTSFPPPQQFMRSECTDSPYRDPFHCARGLQCRSGTEQRQHRPRLLTPFSGGTALGISASSPPPEYLRQSCQSKRAHCILFGINIDRPRLRVAFRGLGAEQRLRLEEMEVPERRGMLGPAVPQGNASRGRKSQRCGVWGCGACWPHSLLHSTHEHLCQPCTQGCKETPRLSLLDHGFAVHSAHGPPSPGRAHPRSLPCTHTVLTARTHASERLPQAWERTCGLRSRAAILFLLPSPSSWLFGLPGEAYRTPRSLVQTLKSCLGGRNLSERSSRSRSATRTAPLSLRPALNQGKSSDVSGSGSGQGCCGPDEPLPPPRPLAPVLRD